jgi:hypothetical protein
VFYPLRTEVAMNVSTAPPAIPPDMDYTSGADQLMIDADVLHGEESEPIIRRLLDDPRVD